MQETPHITSFWRNAFAIQHSVTPKVAWSVIVAVLYSALITIAFSNWHSFNFAIGPFELTGAFIGLLLVFRINAGYDRWWEGRKLWGGIVNQSRNLAISAHTYGPKDAGWQEEMCALIAAFPYVTKQNLRSQRLDKELLFVPENLRESIIHAQHMPSRVITLINERLLKAKASGALDHFCFLQIDKEKAQLIDHMGACERILKTPVPRVVDIKIRRLLLLFLLFVPFLLIQKVGWFCPLIMAIITYPLLSLDQIGIELQNPFSTKNLSHLPLDEICHNIQRNVDAVFKDL